MYDLVIRSARIVTPDGVVMGDVGITGERISAIGQGLGPGEQEMDATGTVLFPGIVDAHMHLGVPSQGLLSADDVESGTRAAVFGGVTTVVDFSVQEPGEDLLASFERRLAGIEGRAFVDVALHANMTSFSEEGLAQIPILIERGVPSFKVFTAYAGAGLRLLDNEILRVAAAVGEAGGLLMAHAENGDAVDFLRHRLVSEGKTSAADHELSHPDLVEAEAITRVATLARLANCPLYVVHVSSVRGMELVHRFREEGWEIHAETCPQYLLLDRSRYGEEQGHRYVASPPLRGEEDRRALTTALADGGIEVVSSDHAPFTCEQKDAGGGAFHQTPGGLPGVETLFPLMFSHLVALGDGGLTPRSNASLLLLARVLAQNPARLFGLASHKGALREGADADFMIFDPNPVRTITAADLHGAADWTPYEGSEVRGEIKTVYLRGRRVIESGQLHTEAGWGRFVRGAAGAAS